MIRFLNVYYPDADGRAPALRGLDRRRLLSRGNLDHAAAPDTSLCLAYEQGLLKIAGITALTLILSYYFDLYEPQIVSVPLADLLPHPARPRLRLLHPLRLHLLLSRSRDRAVRLRPRLRPAHSRPHLSAPRLRVDRQHATLPRAHLRPGRRRLCPLHRRDHPRPPRPRHGGRRLGGHHQSSPPSARKSGSKLSTDIANSRPAVHRIIVAMESRRGELPVQELLSLRFQGIAVEEVGTLRERLSGKIQLDGLRPSSFLYSEGFRIRASQQFTRQVVSDLRRRRRPAALPALLPLRRAAGRQALLQGPHLLPPDPRRRRRHATSTSSSSAPCSPTPKPPAPSGPPRTTPASPRSACSCARPASTRSPSSGTSCAATWASSAPARSAPSSSPGSAKNLPFYYLRHLIRPGLTGWAQVRYGYGATLAETKEKLEYDLYYLKHMSLGLDLLIMFETIKTIVRRRGAQ